MNSNNNSKQTTNSSSCTNTIAVFSKYYLPFELIRIIQEYTNINNLLITCKSFDLFRYELFEWKVNKETSESYYHNKKKFRDTLHSRMMYPNIQLSLNLCECRSVTDVSIFGNVHTLDLYGCTGITDVSALGNVHTLGLSSCTGITDVSALGNAHTLNLSDCIGIPSAEGNHFEDCYDRDYSIIDYQGNSTLT